MYAQVGVNGIISDSYASFRLPLLFGGVGLLCFSGFYAHTFFCSFGLADITASIMDKKAETNMEMMQQIGSISNNGVLQIVCCTCVRHTLSEEASTLEKICLSKKEARRLVTLSQR